MWDIIVDLFEQIFPFIGILGVLLYVIFSKKNKQLKILFLIVIVAVYFIYFFIGLLFNTNILNAFNFFKNGFRINIIGLCLLITTSVLVLNFIQKVYRQKEFK